MDKKVNVIRLVSKVEDVEIKTADEQYRLSGRLTSDQDGAIAFDGGAVQRQEDGAEIARVNSWSRHSGLSVSILPGQDLVGASGVVKSLIDMLVGDQQEGGAA